RQSGKRTLAVVREEALGGELRIQPLEPREMVAEPEALDRQRAQAEVAALLEELRAAVDVHALAVGEVEPQCIEAAARHGHAEAGAVAGIGRASGRERVWV